MLTPIDLVMVSKESSFKELSNGMHFNQVQHIPGMVNVRVRKVCFKKSNSDRVYRKTLKFFL